MASQLPLSNTDESPHRRLESRQRERVAERVPVVWTPPAGVSFHVS